MGVEFRFESFRLVPSEQLLEYKGQPVRLPQKALRLLLALVEAQGTLVSREELTRKVWPDLEYVEPNTFDQTLFTLRKQLADYGASEYIVTVPRRGYKWNGEVVHTAGEPRQRNSRKAFWVAAILLVAAGSGLTLANRFSWNDRDPAAVKALEEGRKLWRLRMGGEPHLREALRLEPDWAEAHAALAASLAFGEPPAPEAFLAVERALALNPSLGEAYATLGFLRMVHKWDWQAAGQAFEQSLRLAPRNPTTHHWYGIYLRSIGRIADARRHLEEAVRLDPNAPPILDELGVQALVEGRPLEASERFVAVGKRFPDSPFWKRNLWRSWVILKGPEASFTNFLDVVTPDQRELLVRARAKGLKAAWEAAASVPGQPYGSAELWLLAGRKDRALDALEEGVRRHNYVMFGVKTDPMFAALHSEPRFHEVLKNVGLGSF
jgi:DNA-binding winged helix-turn-helix (wHTH) protein